MKKNNNKIKINPNGLSMWYGFTYLGNVYGALNVCQPLLQALRIEQCTKPSNSSPQEVCWGGR